MPVPNTRLTLELHGDTLVALVAYTMLLGFDYKGEPVPNKWPDVNSHFGFLDIAGFLKERGHWQVRLRILSCRL